MKRRSFLSTRRRGTYSGGEEIVIKGRNFPTGRGGVSVLFGRHAATNVILESASAIRVTSPAGDRNTKADIVVMFDDGRAYQLRMRFSISTRRTTAR